MTHTNRRPSQRPQPTQPGSRQAARGRHAASFSDAVVAVYIHGISARRRPGQARSTPA